MIAELGHFALVLALCVATLQAVIPTYLLRHDTSLARRFGVRAAYIQLGFVVLAFAALTYGFVRSDFSLQLVALNSHIAKPLGYKIAGVWGNHEGSMVLWILVLGLYGAAFARFSKYLPSAFVTRILACQGLLGVAFLSFSLFTSNPFARLVPPPFVGNGLTPILQDFALAAHPPLLYAGYVGFSLTFCFAMATLLGREQGSDWVCPMRLWTLIAWIFLTLGIALGSFWAYYELGWGGFWFWDPVENASLMPWLTGTALLHCALVAQRRDALKRWTLLLAISTFSLSLAGMFLVRSGVLTSVHAFANDPARGIFILAILAGFTIGGLIIYAVRLPMLSAERSFAPMSREGWLLINNVFLISAMLTVFIGTIYPLVLDALGLGKISVGAAYFNAVFAPLIVPFLLLLPLAPLMNWHHAKLGDALYKMLAAGLGAVLVTLGLFLVRGGLSPLALLIMLAALWLVFGALTDWVIKLRPYMSGGIFGFWRVPFHRFSRLSAAPLAHAGLGLMVFAIVTATAWREENIVALQAGEVLQIAGISLRFDGVRDTHGVNYRSEMARLIFIDTEKAGRKIFPERRFYEAERSQTTEAAIVPHWAGHIYAVIGDQIGDKRVLRLWSYPFISFIWIGAMVMALGGLAALYGRIRQEKI
ncbi:MAG: heme lyase CcmF/NrfE family subunit [Parvibaculales bacterium]